MNGTYLKCVWMLLFWSAFETGALRLTSPSPVRLCCCCVGDAARSSRPSGKCVSINSLPIGGCGGYYRSPSKILTHRLAIIKQKWRFLQPQTCSWTRRHKAALWTLQKTTSTSTRESWKTSQTTSRMAPRCRCTPHGPSGWIGRPMLVYYC